jgi:VIT1/CCC1 family predicted Fe2+/Mn2+ transporter
LTGESRVQELGKSWHRDLRQRAASRSGARPRRSPRSSWQHDALAAHARDELGISDTLAARPVQAALASAATFAVGALLPLVMALVLPAPTLIPGIAGSSLLFLALLGYVAARTGGAPVIASVLRVSCWGALAMGLTAGVGALFGVAA